MDSFSTCPREVRDLIYEHCLIVDVAINPYPADYEVNTRRFQTSKAQRPSPALLAVSKIIGAEARQILYAKNLWQINPNLPTENIFESHPLLFRNVTIAFDQRDLPEERKMAIYKAAHAKSEESWNVKATQEARARAIHRDCLFAAYQIWGRRKGVVWRLTAASSITVDLENFYCPSGCCRSKLLRSSGLFDSPFLSWILSSTVIKGQLNDEERAILRGRNRFQVLDEEEEGELVEDD